MIMEFFDCNVIYGLPSEQKPLMPVPDLAALEQEMDKAGVAKALIRREEQICTGAVFGNKLVADDVRKSEHLWGVWAVLPSHTHELPDPEHIMEEMKKGRIAAWQFCSGTHRFCFHHRVLKDYLSLAQRRNVPILIDLGAIADRDLLDVLEHYPDLTVIISTGDMWPADRCVRPFLREFRNCYLELSMYIGDGTLEDIVREYGSGRILFGSGFYKNHFGGYMLMLKTAQIDEKDKKLIAAGNMERILAGTDYD